MLCFPREARRFGKRKEKMSIILDQGTRPEGTAVKAYPSGMMLSDQACIVVGDITMTMADFVAVMAYGLICTDLEGENDPRIEFVEKVRRAEVVAGHGARNQPPNQSCRRYKLPSA